jgi:hypothetical protein
MAPNPNRLGELLVREKLISLQQLRQAQDEQRKGGQNLGYALAKLGYVSDREMTNFLSSQYRVPAVNLDEYEVDPDVLRLVPQDVAEKHKILPLSRAGASLVVAMSDPTNLHAIDDIKFLTALNVEPVVSSESAILAAIDRYYNVGPSYDEVMADFDEGEINFGEDDDELNVVELEKASEDAPVVRLVNMILLSAIKKGASDIHVEPYEKKLRIRYRVDGGDGSSAQASGGVGEPFEDHEFIGHRGATFASGRAHQAEARQGAGDGLPRVGFADDVGREGGSPSPGQVELAARHDEAGVRPSALGRLSVGDQPALGDGLGDGAYGVRQDHDAVLGFV